ncbi:non-ribosomal peptide synthetase [Chryseobacterium pennae]|uniref:Non-ribosomal peptide synthetase n=1 Tax=Chryseobacterium pennae TaxID=2258962 RepID=A0A3D9C647_9FLAO|nr:non-ribosomal peptide synthetase [Chryseobacterium pennae]REC61333.1 non-ribosomal peptide synthetase [Chryseobacterium pennae]
MKYTLSQQDIYFEQLLFPNEPIYNIGARISIEGYLNKEILEQAYIALIQQHDAYRCYLGENYDNAEMLVTNKIRQLEVIDFSFERNKERDVLDFMQKEFKKPFNIEKDIFLYRFVLIKVDVNYHYLFSVYHHLITDGWGTSLMFTRLVKNYNEILEYGTIVTEYPYSYESFVVEDQKYFNSREFESDKEYWTGKFKKLPENLFQKLKSSVTINTSSRKEFIIKRAIYDGLTNLALETKSSTFHIILAILYTYFGKISQNESISIGLPVLNRSGAKFKKTVGLFMGINPLLLSIDKEETFIELVEKIKIQLKQDYRHQRFPLGQLVNELGVFNQKERIFNVTLSYEKQDYSSHFNKTVTKVVPLSHESERVALALYIREFDETENVKIDFDYNLNYFTKDDIDNVTEHFQTLMEEVLNDSGQKIKNLNFLTEHECHRLLVEFNDTGRDYSDNGTVIQLFAEQAEKVPDNLAVWDNRISLTYKELEERSDKIARYLVSGFGENNEPIGVLAERSAELIILLLGILKAGKCYIPIDPMLPKERVEYIIDHSQASLIIIEEELLKEFDSVGISDHNKQIHFINKEELFQFDHTQVAQLNHKANSDDTAYIIYTSGSTGNPKGVEVGHRALTNFLTSIQSKPEVQAHDILYSVTTYSFDISVLEFFAPLICGAKVFIASKEKLNDAGKLKEELEHIAPTIIQATPSFYQMLFNAGWNGNKDIKILCGGDSLNELLAEKLLNHSKEVWNMYGPTETTIWSSTKKIEKPSDASNIGKPINNTQIYIVDKHYNLLPQNTVGRIFIAGDGLAKGYYKNEELTQEKFIDNPFSTTENNNFKMYETGDLGKWNKEGEIEFLGRNDFQVKVRGFRIELGEIETKLQQYANIKQVVADTKQANGEKVLVAYYTKDGETSIDKTELREYLQSKLPEYMVPGCFVELDAIPLTPNGKIDRKALPNVTGEDLIKKEYVAPRNETEQKLAEIWQQTLGIEKVGITDNFFELGGHSLVAGKIVNSISKKLNEEVSLKNIFQNQTIESLVKVLVDNSKEKIIIHKAEEKELYVLTSDQMNIWLASQKEGFSNAYNMHSVFEIEGDFDKLLLGKSINTIIQENEILRTNFIEKDGGIFQTIRKEISFKIDTIDIKEEDFLTSVKNYIFQSFNLETDTLLKAAVINCYDKKYFIFLTHHIIVDGISLEIILNRLIEIYKGKAVNVTSGIQFKDYSEWQHRQSNFQAGSNIQKLYSENSIQTKVFSDSQIPGMVKSKIFHLSPDQYSELRKISNNNRTTVFSSVLTILSVVLNKIYQQNSICLGNVFNGRNYAQLEEAIGMFIKTLPFRLSIEEKLTFKALAEKTRDTLLLLEENSMQPFISNLNAMTDFLVVYQHSDVLSKESIGFGTFTLKKKKIHFTLSRFPVVFNFFESNGLKCEVEYSENIDETILEIIWEKMMLMIDWVTENTETVIETVNLFTHKEIQISRSVDIDFDF